MMGAKVAPSPEEEEGHRWHTRFSGLGPEPPPAQNQPRAPLSKRASNVIQESAFIQTLGGSKRVGEDWVGSQKLHVEEDEDDPPKKLPVILPSNPAYLRWWYFTMAAALLTGIIDPFKLAFIEESGFYPFHNFWAVVEYLAVLIFSTDISLKFLLAYSDPKIGLITDHKKIAVNYCKFMLWVDLITTFPFDGVISAALGFTDRAGNHTAVMIGLMRWLRIGRMYRVFDLFSLLEHKMIVSQVTLILLRNILLALYCTHWFACLFYFSASVQSFSENSWVGHSIYRFEDQPVIIKYVYAMYFSVGAFGGFGDNDFFCQNAAESIIMIIYLLFNIVLQAYILGTITMVMVTSDERSRIYRDRMEALKAFEENNDLPDTLSSAMREHVELQHMQMTANDEQVLADYPASLRRKALRHMYADVVRNCPLFRGAKARFLDQVLGSCRTEVFMPHVPIMTEGDVVSELMIMVEGEARSWWGVGRGQQPNMKAWRRASNMPDMDTALEAAKSFMQGGAARRKSQMLVTEQSQNLGPADPASRRQSMTRAYSSNVSRHSLSRPSMNTARSKDFRRIMSSASNVGMDKARGDAKPDTTFEQQFGAGQGFHRSDCIGAVPFLTDAPSLENVYTVQMTRVLVVSKTAYDALAASFPQQMRMLMENMKENAEEEFFAGLQEVVTGGMMAQADYDVLFDTMCTRPSFTQAKSSTRSLSQLPKSLDDMISALPAQQKQRVEQLNFLRKHLTSYCKKEEQMRTYEFLLASATGDMELVRSLMSQGVLPGAADYDKRSALMVAAHEGQDAVVRELLMCGAPVNTRDAYSNTALSEAAMRGHDLIIEVLLRHGATLGMDELRGCMALCRAIVEGELPTLRRFLKAGANPNWVDYDGRTAMHIAASQGQLLAVQILVEVGDGFVDAEDRWGNTPAHDALAAGHTLVAEYLAPMLDQVTQGLRCSWHNQAPKSQAQSQGQNMLGSMAQVLLDTTMTGLIASALKTAPTPGGKAIIRTLEPRKPSNSQVSITDGSEGEPETAAAFIKRSSTALSGFVSAARPTSASHKRLGPERSGPSISLISNRHTLGAYRRNSFAPEHMNADETDDEEEIKARDLQAMQALEYQRKRFNVTSDLVVKTTSFVGLPPVGTASITFPARACFLDTARGNTPPSTSGRDDTADAPDCTGLGQRGVQEPGAPLDNVTVQAPLTQGWRPSVQQLVVRVTQAEG